MAWWRSKFTGVWLPLALFLLNFYVCRELFRIEYLDHMGSIEGAYIGISRWVIDHWRDLSWFPLWYGGIPYQDTYPPCLHWLVAIAASIFDLSPARAYHWVAALAYCGGPVTVYALAARLSKSKWIGFAAGLIYSSVSFSAWLIPAYAKDLAGWLHPRRLQTLVVYGDGPHVTALTLLPLALLFLDLAIERPRWFYVALAALAFAATALTNWLGAFALALALACYLLARGRIPMRAIAIVILAYALAMPWIPPSTIALIRDNSARVGGDFTRIYHSVWIWAPIVLAAIALLKFAIRKLEPHLQFAILFSSILTAIVLGAAYFRFQIVPQPDRYHLEMEMALAILLAFLGHAVFSHRPRAGAIALIILITLLIAPIRAVRDYAYRDLIRPIDIASTTEFQLAQWLNRHWNGQRIMTTGSSIYWLTAFSDTPEINGGFDQGETNEMIQVASYGVVIGQGAGDRGAEDSILWLKSLGVHAIAVAGPDSRELYHNVRNPPRFAGLLDEIGRAGGDVIYRIPGDPSLARVVPTSDIIHRAPIHALDVDPLRRYVAALDEPSAPRSEFRWTSPRSAEISASTRPGDAISIQISFHQGWRATDNGSDLAIARDAIGQMYVTPRDAGPHRISLIYTGGLEMLVAHLSSIAVLIWLVVLCGIDLVKLRPAKL